MTDIETRTSAATGIACSAGAACVFTSSDALVKMLTVRYPVFQIIAMQATFALLPILVLLIRDDALRRPVIRRPWLVALRGVLGAVGAVFGFFAFSQLPLADVYAITFCTPIIVTIASIFILGETVRLHRWAAVIAGFIGVLVMVRPSFETLTIGHLAALAVAFTGAGVVLLLRTLGRQEERAVMLGSVILGLLLLGWPLTLVVGTMPSWGDLALAAIAGLIMGTGQVLNLEALRRAPAATVAPIQYTMLVWALLYGVTIFGDPVKTNVLAGAAIIVASSLYIMHRERRHGWTLRAHLKP